MDIKITKQEETEDGWNFAVEIEGSEYSVDLDKEYWLKLTDSKLDPAELILKSFEFLLAREPKESILQSFNLRQINDYFEEFEEKIVNA